MGLAVPAAIATVETAVLLVVLVAGPKLLGVLTEPKLLRCSCTCGMAKSELSVPRIAGVEPSAII